MGEQKGEQPFMWVKGQRFRVRSSVNIFSDSDSPPRHCSYQQSLQERPADPFLVTRYRLMGASTFLDRISEVAARAPDGSADQHEVGGEGERTLGSGDSDMFGFQRLAQNFEHALAELRQLVKEQASEVQDNHLC